MRISAPSVVVNLRTLERLVAFKAGSQGVGNVVGLHMDPTSFLTLRGIDAQYMSLTSAERWGSKPLAPGTVDLLETPESERQMGWPAYILTGITLNASDPDTADYVIGAVAIGIHAVIVERNVGIHTIGFQDDVWLSQWDAAEIGRQFAMAWG